MKPSWGKTIGVFFLCWTLAFLACVFVSMFAGLSQGFSGYSRGGLSVFVVGIVCAAIYRSNGKIADVAIGSIVVGAIVGLLAVFLASQMLAGQITSTSHANHAGQTTTSTTVNSSAKSDASKPAPVPCGDVYVETTIEDPALLASRPLAISRVEEGRYAESWKEPSNEIDTGFKRITFGGLENGWQNLTYWGVSFTENGVTYADLYETLYVALSEMLDDPERARELLYNPNVSATTKDVSGRTIDYLNVYDTFQVDGKRYMFRIHFIDDSDTHSYAHPANMGVEIANGDIPMYGEDLGRLQDLGWPVFYS